MTDTELFEALRVRFGTHTHVALKLGYSSARSYRRVRERGEFSDMARKLALRLLSEEADQNDGGRAA
ncbi:hypothetical protein [Salidesulfovibrio brasiliensis]|uniref:hypothetical protein n=1 Tax=Salidesulfovibrio brasiliensis TaxID=221711 RepID=UPI0006CF84E7|nr:hypothetical protein [Salidesulfovibrio brasiliensis]